MSSFSLAIALLLVVSASADFGVREDLHYGDPELISYINSLATTWTVSAWCLSYQE